MLFKGADNLHMTIYWRWPVQSAETSCNNPATNNAGSASLLFTGTLTQLPETSAYGWVLEVPNFHTSNPPVDDLYGTLGRGSAFQAKCPAGTSPFLMRAEWDYTVGGDLNDVRGATDPCP